MATIANKFLGEIFRFSVTSVSKRLPGKSLTSIISNTLQKDTHIQRRLSTSTLMMTALNNQFDEAKQRLGTLKSDPGNVAKLKLYALFKQATVGQCNVSKPKMFDIVGKAKWDAWNALGSMTKEQAQEQYISTVNELVAPETAVSDSVQHGKYETLDVIKEGKVTSIVFNRPTKKNAITVKMYNEIIQSLEEAAKDDTVITLFTGAGDFYCSGNDLNNFSNAVSIGVEKAAKDGAVLLNKFVSSFIDFPKPLIGLVNGPAIGVSVTVLGLFDLVYASDKATFHTPFSALGQSPEGCASYTFPKLMGAAKANEMLMFNRKITAKEACDRGLVSEVFPDHVFRAETKRRIEEMSRCPLKSLQYAKQTNRQLENDILHKVNDKECENLVERWQSDDCMNAIATFFSQKSNL